MQTAVHLSGETFHTLDMPPPEAIVCGGGTVWGRHDEICTPAYWAAQAWMWQLEEPTHYQLGEGLEEELLACLLGGYGIPAEVGLAAFDRLRPLLYEARAPLKCQTEVAALLNEPLEVCGRTVRYRFANQKARCIAASLAKLDGIERQAGDRDLRRQLMDLPGVGPKTASWIVRNLRQSDDVAILDVHILRAGSILGIFSPLHTVERHYFDLEAAFLNFADAIGVRASILDSVIWMSMRRLPAALLHGIAEGLRPSYNRNEIRSRRASELLHA